MKYKKNLKTTIKKKDFKIGHYLQATAFTTILMVALPQYAMAVDSDGDGISDIDECAAGFVDWDDSQSGNSEITGTLADVTITLNYSSNLSGFPTVDTNRIQNTEGSKGLIVLAGTSYAQRESLRFGDATSTIEYTFSPALPRDIYLHYSALEKDMYLSTGELVSVHNGGSIGSGNYNFSEDANASIDDDGGFTALIPAGTSTLTISRPDTDLADGYDGTFSSTYCDTDADNIPNYLDLDSDNDGSTDADEVAAGTDYLDPTDNPAMNEIIEDIAGNANGTAVTAAQINSIIGLSGAITDIDYTTALDAATYVDETAPTIEEIQAVINSVNENIVIDTNNPEHLAILGVSKTEADALIALYNDTNGTGWTNNQNWTKLVEVATWSGITVNDGNVTVINIKRNNLVGTIPAELGNLSELLYLDLQINNLSGSIPTTLGNLTKLDYIALDENQLTGSIPSELSNLTLLRYLYLYKNQLTGTIPPNLLLNPDGLVLSLADNNLSGVLPAYLKDVNVIQGDRFYRGFDLYNNKFTFSDIEPNYATILSGAGINGIDINNGLEIVTQKAVDSNRVITPLRTEATLTITPELAENPSGNDSYQWFKDGVAIAGATNRIYTKDNITLDDAGVYTYEVNNSVVTELTLQSNNPGEGISVDITDVRAEVIEDIAGNTDGVPATAEQINAITGVSGAVDGVDYSAALAAAKDATPSGYVDPANPTAAEIQAVIDSVNASNDGLSEVAEDIAGNTNGTAVTAEQINAITGVSGAVDGVDYSAALAAAKDATPSGFTPTQLTQQQQRYKP